MTYTYEKKKCTKTARASLGWVLGRGHVKETRTCEYQAWVISNPQGRKVAEASSEKNANFICVALNK